MEGILVCVVNPDHIYFITVASLTWFDSHAVDVGCIDLLHKWTVDSTRQTNHAPVGGASILWICSHHALRRLLELSAEELVQNSCQLLWGIVCIQSDLNGFSVAERFIQCACFAPVMVTHKSMR